MTLLPARAQSRRRIHNPTWELRERGASGRSARLENREKRNRSLVAPGHLAWDCGRGERRQEGKDWRDDQPLQRHPAERQECRENDQGNASDGDGPAGSWHCTFYCITRVETGLRTRQTFATSRRDSDVRALTLRSTRCAGRSSRASSLKSIK